VYLILTPNYILNEACHCINLDWRSSRDLFTRALYANCQENATSETEN